MSPLGAHHLPGESATAALGRIASEKLLHHRPSPKLENTLSWAIHIGYGLVCGGIFGALRRSPRNAVRTGAWFGAGLWLLGDELLTPLLGLADKPTAYPASQHVQGLLMHLGYGIATATTTRVVERST